MEKEKIARYNALCAANRAIITEARRHNRRAGSDVFDLAAMRQQIETILADAVCVSALSDEQLEQLRLAELDADLIALVAEMTPDTIEVAGFMATVSYPGEGQNDKLVATLSYESFIASEAWKTATGEVVLPSGQKPLLRTYTYPNSTSYPVDAGTLEELRDKVRKHLNDGQWSRFKKPEITIPTEDWENASLPAIQVEQYGEDALTGEALHAYGSVVYSDRRYYGSETYFKVEWFRDDKAAAETAHAKAAERLTEFAAQARETRLLAERQSTADNLCQRLHEAYRRLLPCENRGSVIDLREEIDTAACRRYYSTVAEYDEYICQAKSLICRTDQVLEAAEQNRQEQERKRAAEEASQSEELAAVLAVVGDNLSTARLARDFAEAAVEIAGGDAYSILRDESEAPYGWARRKAAIERQLPGLADTDAGYAFMRSRSAETINDLLTGAVAWLEKPLSSETDKVEELEGAQCQDEVTIEMLEALRQRFKSRR